jgi:molybdopterin-guanine dinucleotide biosynthesis protein A
MGSDKALALLGGRPLVEHALTSLAAIAGTVWVVRRPGQGALPCPTLLEPDAPDHHPLLGVAAALGHARTPVVLVGPVDLPGVRPATWAALLASAPAFAVGPDGPQPLLAALPAAWAARARALADAGAPARALTEGAHAVVVDPDELAQADTPAALTALAARFAPGFSRGGP